MRHFSLLLSLLLVCISISTACAESVVNRVRTRDVIFCGGVARPGLASRDGHHRWVGLEVDVCHSVAAAVLGYPERIEFHAYESEKDYDTVRKQEDDIFFLSGSEIHEQNLEGSVLPGPTIFVESQGLMVAGKSTVHHLNDLAGNGICFFIGSPAERSLNAYFDRIHRSWFRRAFSEDGEMIDTYAVQNCSAIAGEVTTLAAIRSSSQLRHLASRILPETLMDFPVMATTGLGDARWSAIVAWTVHTLISAEKPDSRWEAGGAGAMPVTAPDLILEKGWQHRVLSAVGNYGDIFERNLGMNSALKTDRGLNANHINGGLLMSPFVE